MVADILLIIAAQLVLITLSFWVGYAVYALGQRRADREMVERRLYDALKDREGEG
jgi:hypothetical protein